MNKALVATQKYFESSMGQTPEYKSWHRLFKREFTAFLTDFMGCSNIQIGKPNHFDISGFFQRPSGQIWYFLISDLRWSKDNMLVRTAESFKDYTGETNQYVALDNEVNFTFAFRNIILNQEKRHLDLV